MLSRGRCFCYYHYVPSRLRGWASSFLGLLIGGCAIPVNLIVSHGVAVLTHRVARVALHRVDAAILHLLHNPHMVGRTVLASIIPVEKDDVAGARLIAVILPQPTLLEPGNTLGRAGRKLRDHAGFDITALIGAPAYKAGAPWKVMPSTSPSSLVFVTSRLPRFSLLLKVTVAVWPLTMVMRWVSWGSYFSIDCSVTV